MKKNKWKKLIRDERYSDIMLSHLHTHTDKHTYCFMCVYMLQSELPTISMKTCDNRIVNLKGY